MRFWDSSALVPLLAGEAHSEAADRLLAEDPLVAAWWGTGIECASAIRRREREDALAPSLATQALERLRELAASWHEVLPGDTLRAGAERALAVHPLRAADALQLAAAIEWRGPTIADAEFVCFDERLCDAARREGFRVLPA